MALTVNSDVEVLGVSSVGQWSIFLCHHFVSAVAYFNDSRKNSLYIVLLMFKWNVFDTILY